MQPNSPEMIDDLCRQWHKYARTLAANFCRRQEADLLRQFGGVDEFVSVALLAMFYAARAFDPSRAAFKTLLVTAVRRRLWGHWRKQDRKAVLAWTVFNYEGHAFARDGADPERAEEAVALRKAIARLPERERFAIRQHFFGGEKCVAVAARLGVSKERVRQLILVGLARLREALGGDPFRGRIAERTVAPRLCKTCQKKMRVGRWSEAARCGTCRAKARRERRAG